MHNKEKKISYLEMILDTVTNTSVKKKNIIISFFAHETAEKKMNFIG